MTGSANTTGRLCIEMALWPVDAKSLSMLSQIKTYVYRNQRSANAEPSIELSIVGHWNLPLQGLQSQQWYCLYLFSHCAHRERKSRRLSETL